MIYQFKCIACGACLEHIQPMSASLPEALTCKHCGGKATQVIQAPAIARRGETNAPLDVVIGHSAEARWARIHERQAARDKVRSASGQVGLTATSATDFAPITNQQRALRTATSQKVQRQGLNPVYEGTDAKLVG